MITKHCRHVSIDRGTSCVIVQPATNTYSRVTLQVIEVLKQRGEKAHLVLATHELGDVHAHFGNWRGASVAWNDALDMLLGPYQARRAGVSMCGPVGSGRQLRSCREPHDHHMTLVLLGVVKHPYH